MKNLQTPLKFILAGAFFLAFLVFSNRLGAKIDQNKVAETVANFGIIAPLVFILLDALSTVFAPISAIPFWIASFYLFSWPLNFVYIYSGSLLGNTLNFWISRTLGRPYLHRFVGKRGVEEIDRFTEIMGIKVLILLRFLGGAITDFLSYAAGLTPIKFSHYFLITSIFNFPLTLTSYYLLKRIVFDGFNLSGWLIAIFGVINLASLTVPIWIYRQRREDGA